METLLQLYSAQRPTITSTEQIFLQARENNISQDLWQSAGGFWSQSSILKFRSIAMQKLAVLLPSDPTPQDMEKQWAKVVRDFHQTQWGEQPLPKKEKLPLTPEQKTSRELLSYIIVLVQTTFITKTIILYFGINKDDSSDSNMALWLALAIGFSFLSLTFFAFRKYFRNDDK